MRALAALLVLLLTALVPVVSTAAATLRIYFVDVEGGQSTLVVTPAGESLLIDAGYGGRGGRDPARVLQAIHDAGIERIDYLLATHFHSDHVGGIPELSANVPITTFIDYGEPLGTDRMASRGFRNYEPVRGRGDRHIRAEPGAKLPLQGISVEVVSAGGDVLTAPLDGAGARNYACVGVEDHVADGTENYRSVGVMIQYGRFRFLTLGDLSGNTLTKLACPRDLLGAVSAYQVAHHGAYDSNVPALYAALRPGAAILNNGATKGAAPYTMRSLLSHPAIGDLWQLHASLRDDALNTSEELIANLDDADDGHRLELIAQADGGFRIGNGRTGTSRSYSLP
jgi:beta-lactamase superfamily II metal-dependent hydrolase